MALSFTTAQSALEAWIVAATGVASAKVFHPDKKNPQPDYPYITVKPGPPRNIAGGPDEVLHAYDADEDRIVYTVVGRREFTVSLQAYSFRAEGVANVAAELLSKVQTAAALPSRRAAFVAAGLALIDLGNVLDLSGREGAKGIGRASLDARFYCVDTATEADDFIETVEATGQGDLEDPTTP